MRLRLCSFRPADRSTKQFIDGYTSKEFFESSSSDFEDEDAKNRSTDFKEGAAFVSPLREMPRRMTKSRPI